jgi:metallo-beta-lactamase class B
MKAVFVAAAILAAALSPPMAAAGADDAAWTRPVAPFRIVGGIYYVGTEGLAAYLITSGRRAVLLDGTLDANALLIERNIERLGFRLKDVRIILNSHAHRDHAGAIARLRRDTGAQFYASAGDRWALEHGEHDSDTDYPRGRFPPVPVDHVIGDGERVALGDVRLTAILTPGHTKGCTTWATRVIEAGRRLDVVFPCSLTVAGNILVGNRLYPGIARDFAASFARLGAVRADVVLTSHPEVADVLGREKRVEAGDANAFVDPGLLPRIVAKSKAGFEAALAKAERGK